MLSFSILKKGILVIALVLTCLPVKSQIKPEVILGLRYNSDILFRTTHDNHPLAIEAGGGINFNEKWYTGVNANYFRTKSTITDAKHYLIELELRRSLGFTALPKLGFFFLFRPGYIFVNAYSYQQASNNNYKTMTISLSTGVSYSIANHIKVSLWPGITWLPQESSPFLYKEKIGFFCGTGLTYKF